MLASLFGRLAPRAEEDGPSGPDVAPSEFPNASGKLAASRSVI